MNQDAINVSIDVKNLNFYSINLTHNGLREPLMSAQIDNATSRIVIAPVLLLQAGQTYELEFEYIGLINPTAGSDTGGLFYNAWNDSENQTRYLIATHMETGIYGTPSVFPCFDDPGFKAQFNITLIHPQSMVVLANMLEENPGQEYGNGYNITNFPLTNPMSTYLIAFAMGDFVSKQNTTNDGILFRVWSWQGMEPYLDLPLQTAIECFEALTQYTGIKFPMNKLDHLALPDFPVGGEENWGLIIYEFGQVLFDSETDTTHSKMYGIGTRCHEMTHQWFGDLVTNVWWSDIILDEGVARYFESYAPGLTYPKQAKWENEYFVQLYEEYAFIYDSGIIYDEPFYPLVGAAESFNDVFTVITYDKGGAVLRMLAATLGADNFQKGMQRYLDRYKFGNADHVQYFEVMTEIAHEANLMNWCNESLDVNQLMNNWVTQVHFPALRVSYDPIYQLYEVYQEPYLPNEYLPSGYNYTWNIPIQIISGDNNKQLIWLPADGTSCSTSPQKLTYPSIYDFIQVYNYGATTLARTKYDDPSFAQVIKLIQNQPDLLDVSTKIRLFYDEWAWVYENLTLGVQPRFDRVMQILDLFTNNSTVGSPAFNAFNGDVSFLNFLMQLFMDRYESDLLMKALSKILDTFYNVIGANWNEPTDDWNLSILQQSFLPYAVLFNVGDARQKAVDYFQQIIVACNGTTGNYTKCNPIKPDIRQAVYCGTAWSANKAIYDQLLEFLADAWVSPKSAYFDQEIISIEQGLGCLQDPNLIQTYIGFLVSHKTYDPLTYFQFNLKASDVMHEMLQTNPQFILHKSTYGFGDFLNGMTYLWSSQNRLDQLLDLNKNLSSQMSSYDQRAMNNTISNLQQVVETSQISYGSITRWLYDNLTPYGQSPWKTRLPNNFQAVSYELHLQPYFPSSYNFPAWKNFTFDGNIKVTLATLTNVSSITINSHRQIINSIQLAYENGTNIPYSGISRDYDNALLTVDLSASILTHTQIVVTIGYTGFISNQPSAGVYTNYDYLEIDGKKSWIFGTLFEDGPSTRSLAPCLDEPDYKATWHVTVDYPSDLVALGNTIEESVVTLGDGRTRVTFKQTPEMSSYLIAVAVGDFSSLRSISTVDKKLIRIWTWSGMETYAQEALTVLGSTIDFMTIYFNISLPLDKFDLLALPQFTHGGAGAMENWGLIIGDYDGILYNPDYNTISNLIEVNEIVAHETVHHWFGDLVSPKWWQYIFLNEGFASYWYIDRIAEAYPDQKDYADYARFYNQEHALLTEEAYGGQEPPIVVNEEELGNPPLGLFGNQVYDKAAAVLHMLSNTIGNNTFQAALQQYLKNFAQKNANDTDLWNIITPFAQNASITDWNGNLIDISTFMRPYTYQSLFPILKVVTSPDGTSFSYQQTPFFNNQNFTGYKWNIPIFSIMDNNDDFNWLATKNSLQFSKKFNWRVDNYGRKAYARVWYDDASWEPIYQQIKQDYKVFDPTTRAQLLGDTFALVRQNLVPWKRLLDLTLYLKNEDDLTPFSIFFTQDSQQFSSHYLAIQETLLYNFKFQPEFPLVKKYLSYILDDGQAPFSRTGHWNTDLLKPSCTSSLCYIGQAYCNSRAAELFQDFIQNCQNSNCQNSVTGTGKCNSVPPEYRSTQFCYGLKQNQSYYYIIENMVDWSLNSVSEYYFGEDTDDLLNALSCIDNKDFINK
uniref:Aminopeptidase N n=1 Tax=Acrobeloides nanus TaxID=290746 RepID=A0A914C589_9BILA